MNVSITASFFVGSDPGKQVLGLFVFWGGDPGRRKPMRNRDTLKG